MSAHAKPTPRKTVSKILAAKGKEKLVALSLDSAPLAKLADPVADILLVGDSLGMVTHGLESTLPVTLDLMIAHTQAVMRGCTQPLVVIDLPFGTYHQSPEQAYATAAHALQKSGAQAVKIEGGAFMAETIAFLVARGIPVMAHIGLTPQSVLQMGYKVQGKDAAQAEALLNDAKAVVDAGAFALVLEAMKPDVAARITAAITIPTIGIGASPTCDGQVLVAADLLGLSDSVPKFVRRYADLNTTIRAAFSRYADDVRGGAFPSEEETY